MEDDFINEDNETREAFLNWLKDSNDGDDFLSDSTYGITTDPTTDPDYYVGLMGKGLDLVHKVYDDTVENDGVVDTDELGEAVRLLDKGFRGFF